MMALSSAPASGPSLRSLHTAAREAKPRSRTDEAKDVFAFFSTVRHAIAPTMGEGRTETCKRRGTGSQAEEHEPRAGRATPAQG